MTALFWKEGSAPAFGAYHHDHGFGLMHLADPDLVPGKKVWTYGFGKDRAWSLGTTEGDVSYAEIESGPLMDQGDKPLFPAGTTRCYEEYWMPVHDRAECDRLALPELELPPMDEHAWLGWSHSEWQSEWEAFSAGTGPLPESTVPTGLELEEALRRSMAEGTERAAEELSLWLAFRRRIDEAMTVAAKSKTARARWISGLIALHGWNDRQAAKEHLEKAPLEDPVVVAKLDEVYEALGEIEKRESLLSDAPEHPLVIERRANLALARKNPQEAIDLLSGASWQREHQRYIRTSLWTRAFEMLGKDVGEIPDFLGEDSLAQFGAYWSD